MLQGLRTAAPRTKEGTHTWLPAMSRAAAPKTRLWCPESCMMNMADSGGPCQDQAGRYCVPHQQRLVHVRVWHGLDWRCPGRCIQRLLRQLLHQGGVAKGQPPYPVAEAGDALLQATCCRVTCAEMPAQLTDGHQGCVWRQGSLCHQTGGTTLSDFPIPGVTQFSGS